MPLKFIIGAPLYGRIISAAVQMMVTPRMPILDKKAMKGMVLGRKFGAIKAKT